MIRRAFSLRLKPGGLEGYVRQHEQIWPELVAELKGQGVETLTIFQRGDELFAFCEGSDYEAMDRVWASEVHDRWAKVMAQYIDVSEGRVDAAPMREVWHLDTGAA